MHTGNVFSSGECGWLWKELVVMWVGWLWKEPVNYWSSWLLHLGPDAAASVQDAGPWHNQLEEVPRWHMGQHPAVRRRQSRWPVDNTATRMREGKGHFEHLLQ